MQEHYTSLDQTHKRSSLKLYSSGENSPHSVYAVYAMQVGVIDNPAGLVSIYALSLSSSPYPVSLSSPDHH